MSNLHRALRVAAGHESGTRICPGLLLAIVIVGAPVITGLLALVLAIGPGR